MKIETKLEVNQEVYLMFQNRIRQAKIKEIRITIDEHGRSSENYCLHKNPVSDTYTKNFESKELFASKELLLKSL